MTIRSLITLIVFIFLNACSHKTRSPQQTSPSASANNGSYCIALRGNGESAPAHWGAMAQLVEKLGLPTAQTGGSSSVVTMTLLDGIASSPYLKNLSPEDKKNRAALMIKSLHGFLNYIFQRPEWKDTVQLFSVAQGAKNPNVLKEIQSALLSGDSQQISSLQQMIKTNGTLIKKNLATAKKLNIINPQLYAPLLQSLEELTSPSVSPQALPLLHKKALFYISELQQSINVFGKFDAATDTNLFFRPGIISFEGLAQQVGQIAEFYAAEKSSTAMDELWQRFFSTCEADSFSKTWDRLIADKPECQKQLTLLANTYFSKRTNDKLNFAHKKIGVSILSFPITSVLTGEAYKGAEKALSEYPKQLNSEFGKTFVIKKTEDVKIGYWADSKEDLKKSMPANDIKSTRYKNLGSASWSEALRLSPAEPGLSPIKPFTAGKESLISVGGWPDLAPTLLLQAAQKRNVIACEDIIYITRRGAESLFAQGVAKRIYSLDKNWDTLLSQPEDVGAKNTILNNIGDTVDMTSAWSKLYNISNPESSLQRSIKAADAILCTSWNSFDIKNGVGPLFNDAYQSPFYVTKKMSLINAEQLTPLIDKGQMQPEGYPTHVGCFPLEQ